jgi:Plasmid pRiA4b ORF-3-like protein
MAKKITMKTIASLPQVRREVWEIGRRGMNLPVAEREPQGELPELLLAVQSGQRGGVVQCDVVPSSTPATALADFALRAMAEPLIGKPRRPQAVRVTSSAEGEALVETLAMVGVWLEVSSQLTTLDTLYEQTGLTLSGLAGDYRTQALQSGVSLREEALRELFRTARAFYRAELWLDFGDDAMFEIEVRPAQKASKTLYGILMGSMDQEYGLALFASLEELQRFYEISAQHMDQLMQPPPEPDTGTFDLQAYQEEGRILAKLLSVPSLSLTFTPQQEVPTALLEEARRLKLPLANKSAFPLIVRTGEGQMKVAAADDLRDVLWAMQAILDWDRQIGGMDVEDEMDITITSNLEAVAEVLPSVLARTTVRPNPGVFEERDEALPADLAPDLNDLLSALFAEPPRGKPRTKAKSGKTRSGQAKKVAEKKLTVQPAASKAPHLYTLQVSLTGGPIAEAYQGQIISRTIEMRGSQSLHDLHKVIFKAFDRVEEHLYEFNLGQGPRDRSKLYLYGGGRDSRSVQARDPEATTLDSLDLRPGRRFGYTFDMGDNWEHIIDVLAVEAGVAKGRYPRVVEKVGASPPQYPDDEA